MGDRNETNSPPTFGDRRRARRRGGPRADAGRCVKSEPVQAPEVGPWRHSLYDPDDVSKALGLALGYQPATGRPANPWDGDSDCCLPGDTEHQARLRSIHSAGEPGRWRELTGPAVEASQALNALEARAPHLAKLARLVDVNVRAARAIGLPTFLEPVLLVGEPGVGKTWFLNRLGRALGLPFRAYSMSASTLGEGLNGAHPSWRNASPGLVAKTLLQERLANPLFFVDELDKVDGHSHNVDPYRPFYALLEPEGAKAFQDEYLAFAIDASKALWVLAANDADALPKAIVDRLTVIEVPEMTQEQRAVVARSLYEEANAQRRHFFEPVLPRPVLGRLALLSPRSARLAVEHAMARAAADGRRELLEDDVRPRPSRHPLRIGFR